MLPAVPIDTLKKFGLYASSDTLLQDGDDPANDLDFDSGRTWIPISAKLAAYCTFLNSRRMDWSTELFNVLQNRTCKFVHTQRWMNVITSKWVYKCKRYKNGAIERLKSRLVIQGFNQRETDRFETFSSLIQITSVRYLLALASRTHIKVHHIDINTDFLHLDVDSNIFMELHICCFGIG
jgi:hypothetical protein